MITLPFGILMSAVFFFAWSFKRNKKAKWAKIGLVLAMTAVTIYVLYRIFELWQNMTA